MCELAVGAVETNTFVDFNPLMSWKLECFFIRLYVHRFKHPRAHHFSGCENSQRNEYDAGHVVLMIPYVNE